MPPARDPPPGRSLVTRPTSACTNPRPRPAAASTHRARGSPTRRASSAYPTICRRLDVHLREEHTAAAAPGDPRSRSVLRPACASCRRSRRHPTSTAAPSGRRDVVRATRGDRRCRLHGVWDLNPSNPSSANPSSVASPAPIIPAAMSSIMFATYWVCVERPGGRGGTAGAAAESGEDQPRVPVRARGAAGAPLRPRPSAASSRPNSTNPKKSVPTQTDARRVASEWEVWVLVWVLVWVPRRGAGRRRGGAAAMTGGGAGETPPTPWTDSRARRSPRQVQRAAYATAAARCTFLRASPDRAATIASFRPRARRLASAVGSGARTGSVRRRPSAAARCLRVLATKGGWARIQPRPPSTWRRRVQPLDRHHA